MKNRKTTKNSAVYEIVDELINQARTGAEMRILRAVELVAETRTEQCEILLLEQMRRKRFLVVSDSSWIAYNRLFAFADLSHAETKFRELRRETGKRLRAE